MNRTHLISLTAVAMAMTGVVASGANAQEKQYSIGPAIEFSGGGTSFGIKGKIGLGPSISIRPTILFGYTPNVSGADFSKAVVNGGTNSLNTLVPLTTDEKRAIVRRLAGEAVNADTFLNDAIAASTATDLQKAIIAGTKDTTSLTAEQKRAIVKAQPGNSSLTPEALDFRVAAAFAATSPDTDLLALFKQAVVRQEVGKAVTNDAADKTLADAIAAARTPAQAALVTLTTVISGNTPLTDAKKREIVKSQIGNSNLSDAEADALLAAAVKVSANAARTSSQTTLVNETVDRVAFNLLTPEQQTAQVKLISTVSLTPPQADDLAKQTIEALKVNDATKRTDAQIALASRFTNSLPTTLTPEQKAAAATAFIASSNEIQRTTVKTIYDFNPSDSELATAVTTLKTDLSVNTFTPSANVKTAINSVAFAANTNAVGFTPGSGTAYGAAVTYDFETSDKKLTGYFGPRVMFASGSSKNGSFDTNTSETSLGVLLGADYAISPDFTAGLSGTYNFSKTGNLNVSAPGGFNGNSSLSGSSFDVGINLGYRF
jgi:Opacity family porin protein